MQFGISVALLTPFSEGGAIDTARLASHATDLMARGASSVTLFGTTGEAASIGNGERAAAITALCARGTTPDRIILGVCATAVEQVAAQVREGLSFGIRDYLVPPPFYYSGVCDDGLFDWHSQVLQETGSEPRIILYNIPQVTGVRLSPGLAERLAAAFPEQILAIKDSSGDWSNACSLLNESSLPVLIGDERLLHRAVARGCTASITGMGNLYPERLCRIVSSAREDARVTATVDQVVCGPLIPGMKALLARDKDDPEWERVRPPLAPLGENGRSRLMMDLREEFLPA